MTLAEAGCMFMGFILYISGFQGRANSICALKGSSVVLPCLAEHPASTMKWYTVHKDETELPGGGGRISYNMSEESNFTLTISDLRESDANFYCCRETTQSARSCWFTGIELQVADLQVKVIPSAEGNTVTLMCSTSCPLTGNPAAYIWYKNRQFLYQDWSPWYQQLVSSEEAATYSCAVRGYEELRAPQVSVDSVTPSCFSVTYAKGRMCSYKQTSEDEPCSITYPREVHVQRTPSARLTCNTSCLLTDPKPIYRWNHNSGFRSESFSCSVKGFEEMLSDEVCTQEQRCWSVNYVSRRLCALQGSSVDISSRYSHPFNDRPRAKVWYKTKRGRDDEGEAEEVLRAAGRVEYHDNMRNIHVLRIKHVQKNDSAEYTFRLQQRYGGWKQSVFPGVALVVTGLRVKLQPAVVSEGHRVTVTCITSCPLAHNTNYIWSLNGRPLTLPETQNKHLVLDPVSSQHAGNYVCAVRTHLQNTSSSPAKRLIVEGGKSMLVINIVRLVVAFPILMPLFVFYFWMSKTQEEENSDHHHLTY